MENPDLNDFEYTGEYIDVIIKSFRLDDKRLRRNILYQIKTTSSDRGESIQVVPRLGDQAYGEPDYSNECAIAGSWRDAKWVFLICRRSRWIRISE